MISDTADRPLACWLSKERYERDILPCLTIIFKTYGCSWNKCLMCSYRQERYQEGVHTSPYDQRILSQLAWVRGTFPPDQYSIVKIFTSGSVFDPREIPPAVLLRIAAVFKGKILVAETRPEFVEEDRIVEVLSEIDDGSRKIPLFCAIGLETTDDTIRTKCIRKGFSFSNFTEACTRARKAGAGIKAYLLHKPLFLTEREALDDMSSSIKTAAHYADLISMNPCTVQRRTELEWYWKQQAYRPPYLWSVLAILAKAPVHVTCDPVGGGRIRGPHNCGTCDREIVEGIRDYSLNGDRELIAALLEKECACREEWQYILEHEVPYALPLTR